MFFGTFYGAKSPRAVLRKFFVKTFCFSLAKRDILCDNEYNKHLEGGVLMETVFQKNGGAKIQQMIAQAVENGSRKAVVTGAYEIETSIRIPSDFLLVLENCHLRMADGTFCNMFNNEHFGTEIGRTDAGTDRNITLQGSGFAILDGGEYNGLSERTSLKDGNPHISVNNLLLFTNVDGFTVKNIHCRNQRWWALNFIYCCNGKIQDIDFRSDNSWIDADGNRVFGRMSLDIKHDYNSIYVKNSDGIDLRCGCHDILIENITGFTEDDTIALTALNGTMEKMYRVEGRSPDIHNIIIRNVMSAALCSNIRLLNQGEIKLYNVLIDGMIDTTVDSPYLERGSIGIRVGDSRNMYGSRHATADETFNITIRNVMSRAETVLHLAGGIKNLTLDNIQGFDGYTTLIENNAQLV